MAKVVVAMSGGVDSSVAAAILKQQGYDVIGMMLRLWSEKGKDNGNRCCTPESFRLAMRVTGKLDIPFYSVSAQDLFRSQVVQYFLDSHEEGLTPNPCLVCNRDIRWGFLLEHAQRFDADLFATGHYVRTRVAPDGHHVELLRGKDRQKDQSYVLYGLSQEQLSVSIFPLGEFTKSEVREMARGFDLPTSDRADSQDLCFLAGEDYRRFLARYSPDLEKAGLIVDMHGNSLGQHQGLAKYTIGQRKGLGISSPYPYYVIRKVMQENLLIVGRKSDLGRCSLIASEINWLAGDRPQEPFQAGVKVRYTAKEATATITPLSEVMYKVQFDEPQLGITPGQAVVFYNGDIVLGGGIIVND